MSIFTLITHISFLQENEKAEQLIELIDCSHRFVTLDKLM